MSGLSRSGWLGRLRRLRLRRGAASIAVLSLLVGSAISAGAAPVALGQGETAPAVPMGPSVHGTNLTHFTAPRVPATVPDAAPQRAWPPAHSTVVSVASALPGRLVAAARDGAAAARVAAPGTPVFVQPASSTGRGPGRVAVTVASHALSRKLGITGVVFSVAARQGTGKVSVGLDYKSFAGAYGGNFGERLRLVELPPAP